MKIRFRFLNSIVVLLTGKLPEERVQERSYVRKKSTDIFHNCRISNNRNDGFFFGGVNNGDYRTK